MQPRSTNLTLIYNSKVYKFGITKSNVSQTSKVSFFHEGKKFFFFVSIPKPKEKKEELAPLLEANKWRFNLRKLFKVISSFFKV